MSASGPTSQIDAATLEAYRHAQYRVLGEAPGLLSIDTASEWLRAAHARHAVDCSAFLTACNPLGQLLDVEENRRLADALITAIDALGHPHWPGFGADPDGRWPGEPSRLVFGIPRDMACALGRRFAQNAIVWAGADAVPRLVLLR